MRAPNANSFALQWNIGYTLSITLQNVFPPQILECYGPVINYGCYNTVGGGGEGG